MASVVNLLDRYVFSGVPSNAVWDLVKHAWEEVNERSWEELYLEAFDVAFSEERQRLTKYANGEVYLDREALRSVLHQDLGTTPSRMTLSALTDAHFVKALSGALAEHQVMIIGGHNVGEDDYAQLVRNLVRRATASFKSSIAQNQRAFQDAVLRETLVNSELLREITDFLISLGLSLGKLEQATGRIERLTQTITPVKSLLTYQEFAARVEQLALATYKVELVGRSSILEEIRAGLVGHLSLIILYGPGGVGKTRLLLALPSIIPEDAQIWYVRTEAASIEKELISLDRNYLHVLVVDDAHRFDPLPQLREVLADPGFPKGIKVVLGIRSVFRESVSFSFPQIPGDRIAEIEVPSLTNADIDQMLRTPPYEIADDDMRGTLVVVAEGNPLIAQVATSLVQNGLDLSGLTRDQVLARHFDESLHDLSASGHDNEHYATFLEIVAALGVLDLADSELHERVQHVVGVPLAEEQHIVDQLVGAGLIERYGSKLKVGSEVLADYILVNYLFGSGAGAVKYREQIFAHFFDLRPREILTNLAKAEVQGESQQAGLLLGNKLEEFRRATVDGSNSVRLRVLEWLQDIAYFRPEDTFAIVAPIIDGAVVPPEPQPDRWFGSFEISHQTVLQQAVDVIKQTIYRGGLQDAATYLQRLATYQSGSADYERVRKKAKGALVEVAGFEPYKPLQVQLTLLSLISTWLEDDLAGNLDLGLAMIKPMLSVELSSITKDPTEPFRIVSRRGVLNLTEPLRGIRQKSLDILYHAYSQASTMSARLEILEALNGAIPYFPPDVAIADGMRAWFRPDCINTARFFSETVVPDDELPVLDAISQWLWRARRFGRYEAAELDHLEAQLRSHGLYRVYRLLIGWHRWDEDEVDERLGMREKEQRNQEGIQNYLKYISEGNFEQAIHDLGAVVHQAQNAGIPGHSGLDYLLQQLGERYPELAQQLIEHTVAEDSPLKPLLSYAIIGLRRSKPEAVVAYLESWSASDDPTLWQTVVYSYRFWDWSQSQDQDYNILHRLTTYEASPVDHEILWLIPAIASHNLTFAISALKTLADRGDESILRSVAQALAWPNASHQGYAVEFANPQDYLDIVQNLDRLSDGDFWVQGCLGRLGQIAPMQVIDFIERRIAVARERREQGKPYHVIPVRFSEAADSIRVSSEYLDVLRRVRDWMIGDDPTLASEAPEVLVEIAGGLGGPLYHVLMEWVESDDLGRLRAVARLLPLLNSGQPFYDLSRELICRTDDRRVLGSIKAAVNSTPGAIWGGMSSFYDQRLRDISAWLNDDNWRVRRFSKYLQRYLQVQIEQERAEEEFERRIW